MARCVDQIHILEKAKVLTICIEDTHCHAINKTVESLVVRITTEESLMVRITTKEKERKGANIRR